MPIRELLWCRARQLPKSDAREFERLVRRYNYPDKSNVRDKSDLEKLGIKTFFASDACSAYRRTAYEAIGGFREVNTNEDMLIAAQLIHRGYKIAYAAKATVYHSHNLTLRQQYARNMEIGFFLESHAEELAYESEVREGSRLVSMVLRELVRERRYIELTAFVADCAARFLGNRAGRLGARREKKSYCR